MALSYMNEDFMFQLEGVHLAQAQRCQAPLLLNLAACHLRLEDYAAAEHNCSQARFAAQCLLVHRAANRPAGVLKVAAVYHSGIFLVPGSALRSSFA